jgi:hypothetical protein
MKTHFDMIKFRGDEGWRVNGKGEGSSFEDWFDFNGFLCFEF